MLDNNNETTVSTSMEPSGPFLFKMLRFDNRSYIENFIQSITRSPAQDKNKNKFKVKSAPKKRYVITPRGVFERSKKPPQYTKEEKEFFSHIQPTSYGRPGFSPPPFCFLNGTNKETKIGVIISYKDALINSMLLRDSGTVYRPFDTDDLKIAKEKYKNLKNTFLFDDRELFEKKLIEKMQNERKTGQKLSHNEVLARIRWNTDGTSMVLIGEDNLKSRIAAIGLAIRIRKRLLTQAKEFGRELDKNYQVPICFYIPGDKKHFQPYTIFQQVTDKLEAQKLFMSQLLSYDPFMDNEEALIACCPDAIIQIKTFDNLLNKETNVIVSLLLKEKFNVIESILMEASPEAIHALTFSQQEKNLLSRICQRAVECKNIIILRFLIEKGVKVGSINSLFLHFGNNLHKAVFFARENDELELAKKIALDSSCDLVKTWLGVVTSLTSAETQEEKRQKYTEFLLANKKGNLSAKEVEYIIQNETKLGNDNLIIDFIEANRDSHLHISNSISNILIELFKNPSGNNLTLIRKILAAADGTNIAIDRYKLLLAAMKQENYYFRILAKMLVHDHTSNQEQDITYFHQMVQKHISHQKEGSPAILLTAKILIEEAICSEMIEEIKKSIELAQNVLFATSIFYSFSFFVKPDVPFRSFREFGDFCQENISRITSSPPVASI